VKWIVKKIVSLKSRFLQNVFINSPPNSIFLVLIVAWILVSIIIANLYDPITQVAPIWWLNTFLIIDGMLICLILPYRSIFKYILWYIFFSMVFATVILGLILLMVIQSYMNGELSMLFEYKNSVLEPLLGLLKEISNTK